MLEETQDGVAVTRSHKGETAGSSPALVSRQRLKQLEHITKGLCEHCGKPPVTKRHCQKCRERVNRLRRERHRRIAAMKPKKPKKDKHKMDDEAFRRKTKTIEADLLHYGLPLHNAETIALYLLYGVAPGSFMLAVLENNLVHAAMCADIINRNLLFQWANFIYNKIPSDSWGSISKVHDWMQPEKREVYNDKTAKAGS
jgi:hypothetical protein